MVRGSKVCNLSQDMEELVQRCLPVKSLVRFKSVCKAWNTLFTDSRFINLHSNHSSDHPQERFSTESHLLKHPTIDTVFTVNAPNVPLYVFLDSCKGMIAIFYMADNSAIQEIVFWNPATKMEKILPHSSVSVSGVVSLGFGCDAKGDFKAVRIDSKTRTMECEVYSGVADSWSTLAVEEGFDGFTVKNKTHVAIVDGNPYWVASKNEEQVLLAFDTTTMRFKIVPLPKSNEDLLLVDWKGKLSTITCVKKNGRLESVHIWRYYEDHKVWKQDLKFGQLLEVEVDGCIGCSRFGKVVIACTDGKVLIFDSQKKCSTVSELSKSGGEEYTCRVIPYEETLACVQGMTPAALTDEDTDGSFNAIPGFLVSAFNARGILACYYDLAF